MQLVNTDVAYESIREGILDGTFPPGVPLMTEHLVEYTGVSRTPIRDALRRLETDGLVTIEPRRGARVRVMDASEFLELCELRLALESHAADLAARNRRKKDLWRIGRALEEMRRIDGAMQRAENAGRLFGRLKQADVRFHLGIIEAARNTLIRTEILRLHAVQRVVTAGVVRGSAAAGEPSASRRERNLRSHEAIRGAIERSDPDNARREMRAHIQDIIDRSELAGAEQRTAEAESVGRTDEALYTV